MIANRGGGGNKIKNKTSTLIIKWEWLLLLADYLNIHEKKSPNLDGCIFKDKDRFIFFIRSYS